MPEHARQQPRDRVDHDNRGNRAIRQHVIADGNLRVDQMLGHAVIDPFVMTADDDEVRA